MSVSYFYHFNFLSRLKLLLIIPNSHTSHGRIMVCGAVNKSSASHDPFICPPLLENEYPVVLGILLETSPEKKIQ